MTPQTKTIALFAVVAYLVALPLSVTLWGMSAKAWLLLLALIPCAITLGWVKILFLQPRLRTVSGFLKGGVVGLFSYLTFAVLVTIYMSLDSYSFVSGLRDTAWASLVIGTVMFGLPLTIVGAITGLAAEKLFCRVEAAAYG